MARRIGEVSQALLQAVAAAATEDSGPTERELAALARVGRLATKRALSNLVRAGTLMIVRRRPVAYSNKPVAEYAPPVPIVLPFAGIAALVELMPMWVATAVVARQLDPNDAIEHQEY